MSHVLFCISLLDIQMAERYIFAPTSFCTPVASTPSLPSIPSTHSRSLRNTRSYHASLKVLALAHLKDQLPRTFMQNISPCSSGRPCPRPAILGFLSCHVLFPDGPLVLIRGVHQPWFLWLRIPRRGHHRLCVFRQSRTFRKTAASGRFLVNVFNDIVELLHVARDLRLEEVQICAFA